MPIYEEKLICPLAVRFTQEHIRPEFQDGQELEATIKQIRTRPGSGEYDVILEAPFPVIEVMRWRPHRTTTDESERDSKHWFTLDNRRLYCLQRAAVELWPQRVAVAVDANYAAPEGALRKSDSTSAGRSVGIGHSLKNLVDRWDWRVVVESLSAKGVDAALAQQGVLSDDGKGSIGELQDAPAPPSMLDLFMQGIPISDNGANGLDTAANRNKCGLGSEGSTTDPLTPRKPPSVGNSDEDGSASMDGASQHYWCGAPALAGVWYDNKGQSYEIQNSGKDLWSCWRWDVEGNSKKSTLWYDPKTDAVSWGDSWSYWTYAKALQEGAQEVPWYGRDDDGMQRPRFVWWKQWEQEASWAGGCGQATASKEVSKSAENKPRRRRGKPQHATLGS
eukprot:TRINITY_DN12466_c0_g1_i1.p1 TRINITY_DN12466_c0_g1~~TRINITY_DN12466_c0_g1_i1.p1  ORF type:complete len:391 (+),score=71.08 TRINITY_DN12466_c0_g1_i1:85-1257(+)